MAKITDIVSIWFLAVVTPLPDGSEIGNYHYVRSYGEDQTACFLAKEEYNHKRRQAELAGKKPKYTLAECYDDNTDPKHYDNLADEGREKGYAGPRWTGVGNSFSGYISDGPHTYHYSGQLSTY